METIHCTTDAQFSALVGSITTPTTVIWTHTVGKPPMVCTLGLPTESKWESDRVKEVVRVQKAIKDLSKKERKPKLEKWTVVHAKEPNKPEITLPPLFVAPTTRDYNGEKQYLVRTTLNRKAFQLYATIHTFRESRDGWKTIEYKYRTYRNGINYEGATPEEVTEQLRKNREEYRKQPINVVYANCYGDFPA